MADSLGVSLDLEKVKQAAREQEEACYHDLMDSAESRSVYVRRHDQPQAGEQADMENAQERNSVKNRSATGP